jgi:hypothetical protein
MSWDLLFEPRDLWIGLYWDRKSSELRLYFVAIPTIVLLIKLPRKAKEPAS